MVFVTFSDDKGPNITGHYLTDIHTGYFVEQESGSFLPDPSGPIPDAVEITEDQWMLSRAKKLRIDPITKIAGEYIKTDADNLDDVKVKKKAEILTAYEKTCTGSVDCLAGETIYTMNAGEDHASRMYNGCLLAEKLGHAEMTITDFYNVDHKGVSLADAYSVAIQQGVHFAGARRMKNELRLQIQDVELGDYPDLNAAIAAISSISWDGNVYSSG